jgi:hypothetical protein
MNYSVASADFARAFFTSNSKLILIDSDLSVILPDTYLASVVLC